MFQLRIGCGLFDKLLSDDVELVIIEAAAQHHELHLNAAGIADALDRWRRHDEKPTVGSRVESALQMLGYGQDVRAFRLAAFVPRLEHDKADPGIGEVGEIIERRQSGDRNNPIDPRRIEGDLGRPVECCCCAPEGGAVRQLCDDQQISLVLWRDEAGRQTGDTPDANRRQHQPDHHHQPAQPHHAANQSSIGVFHPAIDTFETARKQREKKLRCSIGFGERSHSAHCVGLSVAALTALISAVTAITNANWANICPLRPGTKADGINTAISTRVMPMIGPNNSPIALIAASWPDIPCSIYFETPSTMTIASSTTIPIARISANRVDRLTV